MAIGEIMSIRDGDQLSPMGYGTLSTKWAECEPDSDSGRGREKVRSSSEKSLLNITIDLGLESPDSEEQELGTCLNRCLEKPLSAKS